MRFNEKKATQAAGQFLQLANGRMNYMKLIKLLYIADREALLRWGRPITTDVYFSMKHGPVLSEILDLIDEGPNPFLGETFWAHHIAKVEEYDVSLKSDPLDDQLSEAEEELMGQVFEKFGKLNKWRLVEIVHAFPEWQDPGAGRLPIDYADILKAGHKTPEEIHAIEEELAALTTMDALLGAR